MAGVLVWPARSGASAHARIGLALLRGLATARRAQVATPMERLLDGMSVLVVDDEPDALELFATSLKRLGAEVRSASTVDAALQILDGWRPDAVLCDLHLPGEDGYGLLERVRARPELAGLPLIAISGSHPDIEREKSLRAGFDDHLVKPTRLRDIVHAVSSVVAAA